MAELTFKSAGVSTREIDLSGPANVSPSGTPAAVVGTALLAPGHAVQGTELRDLPCARHQLALRALALQRICGRDLPLQMATRLGLAGD